MLADFQKTYSAMKDEAAEKALAIVNEQHAAEDTKRTLKILGGITAIGAVAHVLNSQALRGLETIETEKLYRHLGYATFVDFLESEDSPLTKSQYYERVKVLKREGDALFDALNESGLSIAKRKLLGTGAVTIEGETLTVATSDDRQETIALNDKGRILQTLSALADQIQDLRRKVKTQDERLERGQADYEELKRKADAQPTAAPSAILSVHTNALMSLMGAFTQLRDAAALLSDDEAGAAAPRIFETIAARLEELRPLYRRVLSNYDPDANGNTPAVSRAMSRFSDDDLAAVFGDD